MYHEYGFISGVSDTAVTHCSRCCWPWWPNAGLSLLRWPLQRGHMRKGLEIFSQSPSISSQFCCYACKLIRQLTYCYYPHRGNSSTRKGTTLKSISNYKEVPNNFTWCLIFLKCISNIHTIISHSSLNLVCFASFQWIENFIPYLHQDTRILYYIGQLSLPIRSFFSLIGHSWMKWFIIHISA